MSSLTHPVGPAGPGVYWRRRVSLLVVMVVAIVALFAFTRGGDDGAAASSPPPAGEQASGSEPVGGSDPAGAADPEPAEEPAGSETSAPPEQAEPCDAAALQVVATADAGSYGAGTTPELGVTVRNVGSAACTVDLGAGAVELLVVSGDDRIWSNVDCQESAPPAEVVVEAGSDESISVAWPRVRSAEGCPDDLEEPRPGTYQLTAAVGGATSTPLAFELE